jgi:hypothetical protein
LEALHKRRCRGPARERINAADESVHLDEEKFNILFVNIRGFVSHLAELTGMLRLYTVLPEIVCLNETFLNRSIEDVELEGYSVVARRDRKDGRQGGEVLMFARRDVANHITLIEESQTAERVWLIIHAETGPYLMCLWYRPPDPGEVASIDSLVTEFGNHCAEALGTIILGDMNVHHTRWLRHSARTSTEGVALKDFCDASGLRQVVRAPTRGDHLLDLVLTDTDDLKCRVLPKIADHCALLCTLSLAAPKVKENVREVWQFDRADWEALKASLAFHDWSRLAAVSAHSGAQYVTHTIIEYAQKFIPRRTLRERKSTHPWVNEWVTELVAAKRAAQGSNLEHQRTTECSVGILEEYGKYIEKERAVLQTLPRGVKSWWSRARRLM